MVRKRIISAAFLSLGCWLLSPTFARAEDSRAQPSNLEILLGVHDVLHITDMLTTTYDLTRGERFGAIEGNPLLRPMTRHPVTLGLVSSALNVVQVMAVLKLGERHPRIATIWAAVLVGVEFWATVNNIRIAGQIQQARARSRS